MTDKRKNTFMRRNIFVLYVVAFFILWSLALSWMSNASFLQSLLATTAMFLEAAGAVFLWIVVFYLRDAAGRKVGDLAEAIELLALSMSRFIKALGSPIRIAAYSRSAIAARRLRRNRTQTLKPPMEHPGTLSPALKSMKI